MDKIRVTDTTGKKTDKPIEDIKTESTKYDLPGVYTEVTEERKNRIRK